MQFLKVCWPYIRKHCIFGARTRDSKRNGCNGCLTEISAFWGLSCARDNKENGCRKKITAFWGPYCAAWLSAWTWLQLVGYDCCVTSCLSIVIKVLFCCCENSFLMSFFFLSPDSRPFVFGFNCLSISSFVFKLVWIVLSKLLHFSRLWCLRTYCDRPSVHCL